MKPLEEAGKMSNLLAYNYLSGKATPDEKKALLEWLEKSDENRKKFSEYRKIYELTAGVNYQGKFSPGRSDGLLRLRSQINSGAADSKQQKINKLNYFVRIAALVVLTFSAGALLSLWISGYNADQTLSQVMHEIIVPRGGKSEVILPDGTKVWLNAGSNFRYGADYGTGNRDVYLEGEGYFTVIENPDQPFVVNTSGLEIKAYGTSFNVKAYPEEKFIVTTLVQGMVKIEGKGLDLEMNPKEVVVLDKESFEPATKGNKAADSSPQDEDTELSITAIREETTAEKPVLVKSDVNVEFYTSWKDNYWIIESESLNDFTSILERKFDVTIRLESPELDQYTFTGTFYKETLEQILDILKLSAPLRYEINEGIVVIKGEYKRKSIYDNI